MVAYNAVDAYAERVSAVMPVRFDAHGVLRDDDGWEIEDGDWALNSMLALSVRCQPRPMRCAYWRKVPMPSSPARRWFFMATGLVALRHAGSENIGAKKSDRVDARMRINIHDSCCS